MRGRGSGTGELFERVRDAVIAADVETQRIVLWNPAAEKIFGYSASEALELSVEAIVPGYLEAQHRSGIAHNGETGHGPDIDPPRLLRLPALRKDGEEIHVELSLSPIESEEGAADDDGRLVLAIVRDVTGRERPEGEPRSFNETSVQQVAAHRAEPQSTVAELENKERMLRESEERFRSLVQNASDIITILDPDGTVRYQSPAAERVLGPRPQEMLGTQGFNRVHPEDAERASSLFDEILKEPGLHEPIEFRVPHADGSWRYLEHVINNLLDDPSVRGIVVNSRDITERKKAEEALKKSEEQFRSLVQHVSDIIAVIEADGDIRYVSPSLERVLGYKPEELVGRAPQELLHPDDAEQASCMFAEIWEKPGASAPTEVRVRHADGSWRCLEAMGNNLLDDPGVGGVVLVLRDVTERKRVEESLRESEERFRATFEQAAVGIAHVDTDGRWLRVNQRLCDIVGYPREELLSLTFQDITHPDDLEADMEEAARLLAGETTSYCMEKRYFKKDGSVVWINLTCSLVREPSGEPSYFIAVIEDITERKRAEEARSRLATIVESSEDAILAKTLDGVITDWNRGAQKIYGYAAEEVVGQPITILVPPERPREIASILERVRRGEPIEHFETTRVKKNGERIDVSITVSPIKDSAGNILGASTIARDVTARKRTEEALRRSEERFRLLVRNSSDIISVFDAEGTIVYQSPSIERVLGHGAADRIGKNVFESPLVYPGDVHREGDFLLRAKNSEPGSLTEGEFGLRHADGSWRYMEAIATNLLEDPRVSGIVTNYRDVTERRVAMQRLSQSEALHRSIIEQAAESIFLVDAETKRLLEANPAFQRSLGYTIEELRGLTLYDIVAHDPQDIERNFRRIQERKYCFLGERKYRRKDGSLRDVEVTVSVVPYGRAEAQCIVAHDVTERKRVEESLRQSVNVLLALYEAGRVLGSTLEFDEIGLRLLEIMQGVAGLSAAAIRTRDAEGRWQVWQVIGSEPLLQRASLSPAADSARESALENERPAHLRLRAGEADGGSGEEGLVGLCLPFRMRERVTGVLEAYGSEGLAEDETIEILTSLTNQAASALENARLYRDLAERERRLQELVGQLFRVQEEERRRVAYEVHDTLAQTAASAHQRLQTYARRHPPSSPKGEEDLDRIAALVQQTVREARLIIADLRPTDLDDFGLAVAVKNEVERLRKEGWSVDYEQKLGEGRLPMAIETALFRVVQEALTNSRKHAKTQRLRIELSKDEQVIRLRVRDWGQGFDPETLTTEGRGQRVGISGMRERVALLGGRFELQSRPGEGTLLSVDLPVDPAEENGRDEG